jgi:hypothetical protein
MFWQPMARPFGSSTSTLATSRPAASVKATPNASVHVAGYEIMTVRPSGPTTAVSHRTLSITNWLLLRVGGAVPSVGPLDGAPQAMIRPAQPKQRTTNLEMATTCVPAGAQAGVDDERFFTPF